MISKVFTKYDAVPTRLRVGRIREIEPLPVRPGDIIEISENLFDYDEYKVSRVENGLEGVKFATYTRGSGDI